jgi:hypothetical protein
MAEGEVHAKRKNIPSRRPPMTLDHCYLRLVLVLAALAVSGCASRPGPPVGASPEQTEFWSRLWQLCGQAFPGRAVEAPGTDTLFLGRPLVMHVRECLEDEIRIPLHVGEDRSRTWILSRTPAGLRLKHDHRHPDGSPDPNTHYGGDTATPGTTWRQEFPADAFSIQEVPARATQAWYLEVHPSEVFVYGLYREAGGLRYRMEFDLTRPVPPPPAPWGYQ